LYVFLVSNLKTGLQFLKVVPLNNCFSTSLPKILSNQPVFCLVNTNKTTLFISESLSASLQAYCIASLYASSSFPLVAIKNLCLLISLGFYYCSRGRL